MSSRIHTPLLSRQSCILKLLCFDYRIKSIPNCRFGYIQENKNSHNDWCERWMSFGRSSEGFHRKYLNMLHSPFAYTSMPPRQDSWPLYYVLTGIRVLSGKHLFRWLRPSYTNIFHVNFTPLQQTTHQVLNAWLKDGKRGPVFASTFNQHSA